MGCKNCGKNKKVKEFKNKVDKNLSGFQKTLYDQKEKVYNQFLDGTHSILSPLEKIAITIFAWVPLLIGYYVIVKFIISIF